MRGRQHRSSKLGGLALGLIGAAALVPALAISQIGGGDPVGTQIIDSGQSTGSVTMVPVNGSIDLCAKTGNVTVAGNSVPIWGYVVKPADPATCADAGAPNLPGPALEIDQGDTVTIRLHNALSEPSSLVFPAQTGLVPDTTGIAGGSTRSYTFTASEPGTYLYESGRNSARQVAMGLHGALIVRPATPGQAYGGPGSAYDSEALLVLSEIDPALNAAPATFDMRTYTPRYWLINGKAFPQTDMIAADAGDRLLLRWLNAGSTHQTMTLLGAHQRVLAKDAAAERHPYDVVAETIAAGQTVDTIAGVPAGATAGTKLPLYNREMRLTNASSFPGGMLTYVRVP